MINLKKPLALDDAYYDLRDSITTVELLLLRVLQFRIPEPHFFDYLTKFLYSMERWCHGRVNPNNQEQVKLFQAVSRTAGNESRQASQHTAMDAFIFTHSAERMRVLLFLPSKNKAPTSVVFGDL